MLEISLHAYELSALGITTLGCWPIKTPEQLPRERLKLPHEIHCITKLLSQQNEQPCNSCAVALDASWVGDEINSLKDHPQGVGQRFSDFGPLLQQLGT